MMTGTSFLPKGGLELLALRGDPRYPSKCSLSEVVMQLRLSTRNLDGALIVDCTGRIVFGEETAYLRDAVKKLIAEKQNVVLNLSEINYIDSGGLGTLVALYTTARNCGSSIKLAHLTQRVGDLLQITKLVTVFDVYDTAEEAAAAFQKGAAA